MMAVEPVPSVHSLAVPTFPCLTHLELHLHSPHVFMACYLVKHRDNFTLLTVGQIRILVYIKLKYTLPVFSETALTRTICT
jgi:hypothetical protein